MFIVAGKMNTKDSDRMHHLIFRRHTNRTWLHHTLGEFEHGSIAYSSTHYTNDNKMSEMIVWCDLTKRVVQHLAYLKGSDIDESVDAVIKRLFLP